MSAACQSLAMIRWRSPRRSASSATSSRAVATSQDPCIAPTSHWPVANESSAVSRRSRFSRVISAGSVSPSMKSTPSSCSAAESLRSIGTFERAERRGVSGRDRGPAVRECLQRTSMALQRDGLFPRGGGIELLMVAMEGREILDRVEQPTLSRCPHRRHGSAEPGRSREQHGAVGFAHHRGSRRSRRQPARDRCDRAS